jgi:cell division cycle protein 37
MSTKKLDYSKWDHIEISDDEDDTHPNIDTPSLFRWRHQARVERMEKDQKEKEEFQKGITDHQQKLQNIKQKLKEAENTPDQGLNMSKLKMEMEELQRQEDEWKQKEEELKKKEKLTPLNVDTICHEGKSKTIINKPEPRKKEQMSEEEKMERQQKFTKENEKLIKKFGMLRKYDDSQEFLLEHPQLTCEETANYLVIWCINLEMEEKHDLMNHVAHQTIVMQFILELARSLELDPRGCVRAFFSRIKLAEQQYMDAFNDELESFKDRIRKRAQVKMEEAMKQVEEEERQQRLGPGGLDPVEVFESLPQVLQECFESKDIAMLQEAVLKLPKEEAEYHIKRCIDSGLWVPGGADKAADSDEPSDAAEAAAAAGGSEAAAAPEEDPYSKLD